MGRRRGGMLDPCGAGLARGRGWQLALETDSERARCGPPAAVFFVVKKGPPLPGCGEKRARGDRFFFFFYRI